MGTQYQMKAVCSKTRLLSKKLGLSSSPASSSLTSLRIYDREIGQSSNVDVDQEPISFPELVECFASGSSRTKNLRRLFQITKLKSLCHTPSQLQSFQTTIDSLSRSMLSLETVKLDGEMSLSNEQIELIFNRQKVYSFPNLKELSLKGVFSVFIGFFSASPLANLEILEVNLVDDWVDDYPESLPDYNATILQGIRSIIPSGACNLKELHLRSIRIDGEVLFKERISLPRLESMSISYCSSTFFQSVLNNILEKYTFLNLSHGEEGEEEDLRIEEGGEDQNLSFPSLKELYFWNTDLCVAKFFSKFDYPQLKELVTEAHTHGDEDDIEEIRRLWLPNAPQLEGETLEKSCTEEEI